MTDLNGKSIIVTGGASGMGAAGAVLAARYGARVTIADMSDEGGQRVVDEIRGDGGEAQFVRTDISAEADVAALVAAAVGTYGALHGAYNNAGVPPFSSNRNGYHPTADLPVNAVQRSLLVNTLGCFLCLKYEIPAMLESGGGAIVNTASTAGVIAIPNSADYVASKHAVIGLTRAAATDYATHNIRVNAILPGVIRTPMMMAAADGDEQALDAYRTVQPIGRLGEPEEVAEVALFLISDAASLMTGSVVTVDGGQTMI